MIKIFQSKMRDEYEVSERTLENAPTVETHCNCRRLLRSCREQAGFTY